MLKKILSGVLILSQISSSGLVYARTEVPTSSDIDNPSNYIIHGSTIIGDVNGDMNVDSLDFVYIKRIILGYFSHIDARVIAAIDFNGDGSIDTTDYAYAKSVILKPSNGPLKRAPFKLNLNNADLNLDFNHSEGDKELAKDYINLYKENLSLNKIDKFISLENYPWTKLEYMGDLEDTADYNIYLKYGTITKDFVYYPSQGFEKITQYNPGEMGLYFVVFKGPVHDYMKTEVQQLGGKLLGYVPDDSFISAIHTEDVGKIKELPFVADVIVYQSEYKVSKDLINTSSLQKVSISFFDPCSFINDIAVEFDASVVSVSSDNTSATFIINGDKIPELSKKIEISYIEKYTQAVID